MITTVSEPIIREGSLTLLKTDFALFIAIFLIISSEKCLSVIFSSYSGGIISNLIPVSLKSFCLLGDVEAKIIFFIFAPKIHLTN